MAGIHTQWQSARAGEIPHPLEGELNKASCRLGSTTRQPINKRIVFATCKKRQPRICFQVTNSVAHWFPDAIGNVIPVTRNAALVEKAHGVILKADIGITAGTTRPWLQGRNGCVSRNAVFPEENVLWCCSSRFLISALVRGLRRIRHLLSYLSTEPVPHRACHSDWLRCHRFHALVDWVRQ